ncbi:hypothetical protein SAMN04487917_101394 [Arthrobacter sp. yr096]|uniref:hypothetical protein n=1 Tax=Arthrobacter sp. yr096 TaxID=1761750 RepID=UPI0008AD5275|nr:hypothetical protein [Arthrobacter sp. yr096]SEI45704.1 hypothetical protein SAMN04487917_101394 [Arthrobacter sp. yr096]
MNDNVVWRAIRQGTKSRPVEHGHGGARQRKNRFAFTDKELAEAMRLAQQQRDAADLQAWEPAT